MESNYMYILHSTYMVTHQLTDFRVYLMRGKKTILRRPGMWTLLFSCMSASPPGACGARVSLGLAWLRLCVPGSKRLVPSGPWLWAVSHRLILARLA